MNRTWIRTALALALATSCSTPNSESTTRPDTAVTNDAPRESRRFDGNAPIVEAAAAASGGAGGAAAMADGAAGVAGGSAGVGGASGAPGRANGAACAAETECASGMCVGNVCCATKCKTCEACSTELTGKPSGTCAPVTVGSDPKNECDEDRTPGSCGRDGACDGNGACRMKGPAFECGAETCSQGKYAPRRTCDGSGACASVTSTDCGSYPCVGTKCGAACQKHADCLPTHHCAQSSCIPRKNNGDVCGNKDECKSGLCIDDRCCNSDCSGACKSCAVPGMEGTCSSVASGTRDSSCTEASASTCKNDGYCAAGGVCRYHAQGTECKADSCTNGASSSTYSPPSRCDGSGSCVASANAACGAHYTCDANARKCRTSCSQSSECLSGSYCENASCLPKKASGAACSSDAACVTGACVGLATKTCCKAAPCDCIKGDLLGGTWLFDSASVVADAPKEHSAEWSADDAKGCSSSGSLVLHGYARVWSPCVPFPAGRNYRAGMFIKGFSRCHVEFFSSDACATFLDVSLWTSLQQATWGEAPVIEGTSPSGTVSMRMYCDGVDAGIDNYVDRLYITSP